LDLFDSDEQRKAAVGEIEREAGNPISFGYWLAVVIIGGAVITINVFIKRWLLVLNVPDTAATLIHWTLLIVCFGVILRWLHRWGAASDLRQKLLKFGVPVCLKCGYALRGLPVEIGRCPECGRPFDERVVVILSQEVLSSGDGETR